MTAFGIDRPYHISVYWSTEKVVMSDSGSGLLIGDVLCEESAVSHDPFRANEDDGIGFPDQVEGK
jgi:hypothetical protein